MAPAARYFAFVSCTALLLWGCALQSAAQPPSAAAASPAVTGADPSINRQFRETADPSLWPGRFEVESREIYRLRAEIAEASGVRTGMSVADVGAGSGLFTLIFARKVGPGGRVTAVDISEPMLAGVAKRAADEGLRNVSTARGTQTDTGLREGTVDLVFTCDTYHHFEQPTPVLASIHRALKAGGRLIVIDFERIPGVSPPGRLEHVRAGKETVSAEVQAAGFRLVREIGDVGLKQNYYLVFEKR